MIRIPGLLTSEEAYAEQWSRKVGTEAAHLKRRTAICMMRGLGCLWLGSALVVAGARSKVLTIIGVASLGLMVVFYIVGVVSLSASKRVTGELLGLKLGVGGVMPPPREPANYEKWCARYGIVPYTALEREAERARTQPG